MVADNKNISFSVIIPVYNGAATIERTLASVLGQSYPPYEIILVDDASTDTTCELVKRKYGELVKMVTLSKNKGSAAARNAGMDIAKGTHIAFIDADDTWHPDKLILISRVLAANPDIVLFFNRYTQQEFTNKSISGNLEVRKLSFTKLIPGNFIATSCIVVKNDSSLRFQADMRYTEDFDFCLRIGYQHNIYYTNTALNRIYRQFTTEGGISSNKWLMRKGELRAYSRLAKLNILFVPLIPFLWIYSLMKHLFKMIL